MSGVKALATLQFSAPAQRETVHLVRMTDEGITGDTLCRVPTHTGAGHRSVGGGVYGYGLDVAACGACEAYAGRHYWRAPVWGRTFVGLFTGRQLAPWSVRSLPALETNQWTLGEL